MFGHTPGDLWSIDPEMQTRAGNVEEYIAAVKNVINEIVGDEDSAVVLKILEELFCQVNIQYYANYLIDSTPSCFR